MPDISYDILQRGVLRTAYRIDISKPHDTFLRDVVFGGAPILGSGDAGYIQYDFRRSNGTISEEAIFGADPNRINYGTDFNENILKPYYMNDVDTVSWYDTTRRVFGEDVSNPLSTSARAIIRLAEKRDNLRQGQDSRVEKLCAEMLLNGKITLKYGGKQTMPMTSSLLSISGANLYTDPIKVVIDAVDKARTVNKAVKGAMAIVMNPSDAYNLSTCAAMDKLLDKETRNLATVTYKAFTENGLMYMGSFIAGGVVEIYSYAGVDAEGNNYIPQGKAILFMNSITLGSIGYGAVMVAENGGPGVPVVMEHRTAVYPEGKGDNIRVSVQEQTSQLPIITAIDQYGVLTGIPASLPSSN